MSSYRFIKELIKDAKKVTKNADEADELQNLAKNYVQTYDDIDYYKNYTDILDSKPRETEVVYGNPEIGYNYTKDPYEIEKLENDAYNESDYLIKNKARRQRAEINDLLEAILLNKQAQENSKKLAINQAINAREYNYPNYLNFNDYSYVRHMNKRLYDNRIRNGIETDKYKKSNIPYLNNKEDDFNDLPF